MLADGTLTIGDAVRFSGIGRTALYRLMGAGRLPYAQQGRRRLVPRKALVELLAAGLVSADKD